MELGGAADRDPAPAGARALLAFQLGDREVDRLGDGDVETAQQAQRSQQLDHRGQLHRLPPLGALHGCLTDPGLGCQLSLGPVALYAVTCQPAAELGENGGVGH